MGGSESKEEIKTVDTNGNVNNNIVIQDPVSIHNQELMILMYIVCTIKIIEFTYVMYKEFLKKLKKRYVNNQDKV